MTNHYEKKNYGLTNIGPKICKTKLDNKLPRGRSRHN